MPTEYIRDFCPKCTIKVPKDAISCNNCGSEDLIPDPYPENVDFMLIDEEQDLIIGAIPLQTFPPKMQPLDKMYEGEGLGIEETDIGTSITPENIFGNIILNDNELEEIEFKEESKLQLDENAVRKITTEKFGFLTGNAGTGKTTLLNEIKRLNPHLLELCATTGIAAINTNSKTVHSTLKFYDTKSLENAWREQLLHMNLRKVRARVSKLVIDEVSMLGAEQLDLICNAIDEINSDDTGKQLGLWVVGDMGQLPPVKMKYPFKSDYWNQFEENKVRLTKVWRQDNAQFLQGIDLLRASKGIEAMKLFKDCGVTFLDKVNDDFEGTTLIPNNNDVDMYNDKRLRAISGTLIRSQAKIRGKEMNEWSRLIPGELRLKVGAYVMILSNDIPEFRFVNGDCGWIEDYKEDDDYFTVKLKRTNNIVQIKRIKRMNFYDKEPEKYMFTPKFQPYQDFKTGDWIIGEISYHPLRLAYASTIHKCLEANTIVREESRGLMRIENIIIGDKIWNGRHFAVVKFVSKSKQYGIKISLENGKFVICSPQHRFPIHIGINESNNIEAQQLKICDNLFAGDEAYYTKIIDIQDLMLQFDMIDIELENTNDQLDSLFLANGILTHNSQGLSLDMVQINTRPPFFGYDAMSYVSISRARTPQGLFLVGDPETIGRKSSMNKEVLKYV